MGDNRPTIPAGDVLRSSKGLPGWLRTILNIVKGWTIRAGPVDIQLDQKSGPLEGPHKFNPPKPGKGF
jgi:hypothetical protein